MFTLNDDKSIYATRGDIVFFTVTADDNGKNYRFQPGDVVRIKIYGKKDAETVLLQKDFPVTEITEKVDIFLAEEDTKFGEVISKPKDYWYEVELNPHNNPQTIVGYDEDGAKVFKLFPEGDDIPEWSPEPEDIPVVDDELDMTSTRPIQNQAVARAYELLKDGYERTHAAVAELHVTPQMFGAIADGEADDTEAFQAAIDFLSAKGGGTLFVPVGSYDVSTGNIVVKSNIRIIGAGKPKLYARSKSGYFSIFTNNKTDLANVEIRGLEIDQWGELEVQPDNTSIPCCCIAFLGNCQNITVADNTFYSIGGWTVSVTDTAENYGSKNTYIANNTIHWKQAGDGTWYDASAIYAESDNHVIEHNFIKSYIGTRDSNSRWKSEGGIETHGIGTVKWNEIHDVQAGINVVAHAYDRAAELKAKREIAFNAMRGVCRGVWFWIPKTPYSIENVEIYSNDIEVVAEGYYAGYGAICCTLTEKPYDNTTNNYNGYLKDVKIYNNKFYFVDNNYTGTEYLELKNVGAISFAANGTITNVEIYNNDIKDFPWPAIATYQWDAGATRYHHHFNIYHNTISDCGAGMANEYQSSVFLLYHADHVYIHDNMIRWNNELGSARAKYLVGGGVYFFEFVDNKQEGSFCVYNHLVSSTLMAEPGIIVDTKNLGYREYAGDPNGNLTPKKVGERVLDTTYKRWFTAVGSANTDWRIEAGKLKGVATIAAGKKTAKVYFDLPYRPTGIQVTALGILGNVYVEQLGIGFCVIACTETNENDVDICWEVEI